MRDTPQFESKFYIPKIPHHGTRVLSIEKIRSLEICNVAWKYHGRIEIRSTNSFDF